MTWNKHVTQTLSKALRIINALSKMARNTWGIGTDQLKYIYIGAIEPLITYGASVWYDALRKKKIVKKLTQFQRLIALRIIKGYKTISGDAAMVIAGLIPLHLRIQESADIYYLKKSSKIEIMGMKSQDIQKPIEFKNIRHPALRPLIITSEVDYRYDIEIYTDGSKTNSAVGSAYSVRIKGREIAFGAHRIGPKCSVFQSELIAIREGLKFVINHKIDGIIEMICVISDSKSSLSAIAQRSNFNPIIYDIHTLIIELFNNGINTHFKWIRGHQGNEGNERADALAKMASDIDENRAIYENIPVSYAKHCIRQRSIERWEDQWINTTKASVTKQFFPTIRHRLQNQHFKPNYEITQFISGHGKFEAYLKRFNIVTDSKCECGNEEETALHKLLNCDIYIRERKALENEANRLKIPMKPSSLIQEKSTYIDIISFINRIHK
jgi:ribonuclease HI